MLWSEGRATVRKPLHLRARRMQWGIIAIVFCLLTPLSGLHAQTFEGDEGEVTAFGGGAFAIGTHPVVGGSTGTAFSKYAMGLIEVAFSPMGQDTLRHRIGPRPETSRLFDFNGSFHIQIPVRKRWAPYGILGGGLLFDSFRVVPTPTPENGQPPATTPPTATPPTTTPPTAAIAINEFNFGFHTGGGFRYYIREGWGIRPEFKVIVSNRTYTRFTIGFFYNLSTGWFL
jgi:hypothetical protein